MAFANYGELKTSVDSWLNRGDLTSQIDDFVALTESDLNAELRHWRMLNRATAEVDSEFTEYPADLVEADLVVLNTGTRDLDLDVVSPKEIIRLKRKFTSTGRPRFAAFGEELQVLPVPDDTYTVEMQYYQRIPSLSGDGDTNWVLTYFPGLYLYGALLQAAPFLHEDERIQTWAQLYQATKQNVRKDETSRSIAGGARKARPLTF